MRSRAPPSCCTTCSAATSDFARHRIGEQLAELLHQRFLAVGAPRAAGAIGASYTSVKLKMCGPCTIEAPA